MYAFLCIVDRRKKHLKSLRLEYVPPQLKSSIRHMKPMEHWYTTLSIGVLPHISPCWVETLPRCSARVMFSTADVIVLMITDTDHIRHTSGVWFN